MLKLILKKANNYLTTRKLVRKYKKTAQKLKIDIDNKYTELTIKDKNKIFVCWLQGMESAPDLVKMCYRSLLKHHPDKEIIVITEENFSDYVKFPQFILDKYNKGYISKTHFSDLLRLELLITYGGTWVDATLYFTDSIPDYILNSDFFLFQDFNEHNRGTKSISSWFISSCANNKLLLLERALLYNYWSKNNKLCHYYLFHKIFSNFVIKLYDKEWSEVIISDNASPKILDCYLFKPFNEEVYKIVADKSFAHKLMYKYSQEQFEKPGTLYQHLLEIS